MNLRIRNAVFLPFALALLIAAKSVIAVPVAFPTDFVEGERWDWRVKITPDVGAESSLTRQVVKVNDGLQFQNQRQATESFKSALDVNPFFNTKSLSAFREWPLEVGKTWQYKGEFMGGETSLAQTAQVVAYEDVTVPAGTFKAFKIEYSGSAYRGGRSWKRVDTYWYAPSVKADVKALVDTPDHQGILELLSYKLVQPATSATAQLPGQTPLNGFPADALTLSETAVRESFSGKTYNVKLANGSTWNWQFKSDGSFSISTSTGFNDAGKWTAKEGRLCTEGRRMNAACNEVRQHGPILRFKRDNGEIVEMTLQ